jgi:hypothetical protein
LARRRPSREGWGTLLGFPCLIEAGSLPARPAGVNASRAPPSTNFARQSGVGEPPAGGTTVTEPASALTCVIPTGVGGGAGQQLQLQGGQVWPVAQAGQAQAQPPPPEPLPPSEVTTGWILAHTPLGQGVVKQAMPSDVHPHWSAVSAVHDLASVYAVQGSGGGEVQSHGAQAVLAGQAGHSQIGTAVPDVAVVPGEAVPVPPVAVPVLVPAGTVIVVVAPPLHEQLQAGQSAPTGHAGQLQVQVPGLPPVPDVPPVLVPHPPAAPPVPPLPFPHWQSQGGHASPGPQDGQPQVQVPPPPLPASTGGGGGQSH